MNWGKLFSFVFTILAWTLFVLNSDIQMIFHGLAFTGWPTRMSLFFFANNFYKNKENFKVFYSQLLGIYRILLLETNLELMFYYTFSVINTMFVPCTALLYDCRAATRTIKFSTTLLSSSCAIRLISFLMMSFLSVDCFQKLCLSGTPQKIVRRVEILGIGWPGVIGFTWHESVPWEVMPEVFKCGGGLKWGGA